MSEVIYKNKIPLLLTSLFGTVTIISYFFPILGLENISDLFVKWTTIMGAIALWVGASSIFRFHVNRIIRKSKGVWMFSGWTIIVFLMTILLGFMYGRVGIFTSFMLVSNTAVRTSLNALQAAYILTGAFRAWRVRRLDALFLVGTITLVYFLQSPFGSMLFPAAGDLKSFIASSFTSGATKGALIAAAFGSIVLAMRIIIGKEQSSLGIAEE